MASVASAATIDIGNSSFEEAIQVNGSGVGNFTSNGSWGTHPFGSPYATQGTTRAAYTNASGTAMLQQIGTVQAGTYRFLADIGSSGSTPTTTYMDVYAFTGPNAYTPLETHGGVTPPAGQVVTDDYSFTVPVDSTLIGQTLVLQFVGGGLQSTVDSVRGDFVAVPEPTSLALLGLGGLAALRRRRRGA
jgi:hypothetical protein